MDGYFLIAIVFIIGIFGGFIFRNQLQKPLNRFRSQSPLIRQYWKLVVPYVIAVAAAYFIVWRFYYSPTNFNVLGQVSALVFAIFVGYIGFAALGESKFDKLFESGMNYASHKKYKLAAKFLEEAHSIKPKDNLCLGNLLEFYLLSGEHDKFDSRIEFYKTCLIEEEDELNYHYLKVLRHLIIEHIREGKTAIRECIAFIEKDPSTRERFQWSFTELTASLAYKNLSGSARNILDNYIKYLQRIFSPEEDKRFREGDYEMGQMSLPVSQES